MGAREVARTPRDRRAWGQCSLDDGVRPVSERCGSRHAALCDDGPRRSSCRSSPRPAAPATAAAATPPAGPRPPRPPPVPPSPFPALPAPRPAWPRALPAEPRRDRGAASGLAACRPCRSPPRRFRPCCPRLDAPAPHLFAPTALCSALPRPARWRPKLCSPLRARWLGSWLGWSTPTRGGDVLQHAPDVTLRVCSLMMIYISWCGPGRPQRLGGPGYAAAITATSRRSLGIG